jgi:hypothetical protein
MGLRPTFLAYAKAIDEAALALFAFPTRSVAGFDEGFKSVYPALAERRTVQRQNYFELYVEAQRCSARAYTTIDPGKIKGGKDAVAQRLTDIGQRLYDVLSRNEDITPETRDRVREVLEMYPQAKKKFDELTAAAPKS